jgi:hypothetical protein
LIIIVATVIRNIIASKNLFHNLPADDVREGLSSFERFNKTAAYSTIGQSHSNIPSRHKTATSLLLDDASTTSTNTIRRWGCHQRRNREKTSSCYSFDDIQKTQHRHELRQSFFL